MYTGECQCGLKKRTWGGVNRVINMADVKKVDVGDELELGVFIYEVDEVLECRVSPLDYPTTDEVLFHSLRCRIVRKIDMVKTNKGMVRKESPVTAK